MSISTIHQIAIDLNCIVVEADIKRNRYFDWIDPLNCFHRFDILYYVHIWIYTIDIFLEKLYRSVGKSLSNWVLVALPCTAPPVVWHEKMQLFLSSSENSESRQRLPKINRLSVQPQGWVRVTLHGAPSLCPHHKHSASLLHWLKTEHLTWIKTVFQEIKQGLSLKNLHSACYCLWKSQRAGDKVAFPPVSFHLQLND